MRIANSIYKKEKEAATSKNTNNESNHKRLLTPSKSLPPLSPNQLQVVKARRRTNILSVLIWKVIQKQLNWDVRQFNGWQNLIGSETWPYFYRIGRLKTFLDRIWIGSIGSKISAQKDWIGSENRSDFDPIQLCRPLV